MSKRERTESKDWKSQKKGKESLKKNSDTHTRIS